MKEITFHNITVTVEAETATDAYTQLCNALGTIESEWDTDTYSVNGEEQRDTSELFPTGDAALSVTPAQPQAVIVLEGGLVQEILTSEPATVAVIDYDTEGMEPEKLTAIPQGNGTTANAYAFVQEPNIMPERVAELLAVIS